MQSKAITVEEYINELSDDKKEAVEKLHQLIIKNLPQTNVLFISNHQTYFADVVSMFHVFNASLKGRVDSIKNIFYIWNPKLNIYFVSAKENGWTISFRVGG
jgi:1-acyl-sn-glycerol-3-phosphate acyltransferase